MTKEHFNPTAAILRVRHAFVTRSKLCILLHNDKQVFEINFPMMAQRLNLRRVLYIQIKPAYFGTNLHPVFLHTRVVRFHAFVGGFVVVTATSAPFICSDTINLLFIVIKG